MQNPNAGTTPSRFVERLALAELDAGTTITLRTQNSAYVFVLSDPRTLRGTVTGGTFGEMRYQALATRTFMVGLSAVIFVQRDGQSDEITTSPLVSIEVFWMQ